MSKDEGTPQLLTIAEFCKFVRMSQGMYWKMKKAGQPLPRTV